MESKRYIGIKYTDFGIDNKDEILLFEELYDALEFLSHVFKEIPKNIFLSVDVYPKYVYFHHVSHQGITTGYIKEQEETDDRLYTICKTSNLLNQFMMPLYAFSQWDSQEFCDKVSVLNPYLLPYFRYQTDKNVRNCILEEPTLIKYIRKDYHGDIYIKKKVHQTPELAYLCIEKNPYIFQYLDDEIKDNYAIQKLTFTRCPEMLQFTNQEKLSTVFKEELIEENPEVLLFLKNQTMSLTKFALSQGLDISQVPFCKRMMIYLDHLLEENF